MNVLHISAVKSWGGGGNHLENLCYELSKTHPEVKNIVVVAENGEFHDRLRKSNLQFYTVPMYLKVNPHAIFKIIRICKRENIDLIHIHGSTSLTLAVIADHFYDLPPFVFSKKTSYPIKNRKQTLYKYNYPKLKKILCVSQLTRKVASKAIKDKEKLQVIYHGTRMDNKSTETPFQLREKFKIPSGEKIIGTIAQHLDYKDLMTWVRTVDYIVNHKKITDFKFIQIGSHTEETPNLWKEIEERKLQNSVFLLGFMPNASNFMKQFDTVLITSKSEGLPQVIYEAFYHEIPVVSTKVGGIAEIIEHGRNGLLSKKGDYESLGDNLDLMLNERDQLTNYSQKNAGELVPTFTTENMARRTLMVYQTVLNEGKREP